MINKKAQGLSINAVILIILGVAVLAVLIAGFLMGWDKFIPWVHQTNNVKTVVGACQTACSSNSLYDYCSFKRELGTEDGNFKNVTCYILANDVSFSKYGISKCDSLSCKDSVSCKDWDYYSSVKKEVIPVVIKNANQVIITENYCYKE